MGGRAATVRSAEKISAAATRAVKSRMSSPCSGCHCTPTRKLFAASAFTYAVDWLYSHIPQKFPKIKICMSEGGISWVAGVMDRIDHLNASALPEQITVTSDTFRRNFWFCSLDEPSGFRTVDTIGIDNIMIESDYPHSDGTWPDTQPSLKSQLSELSKEQQRKICWENGVKLFRHPAPINPLP